MRFWNFPLTGLFTHMSRSLLSLMSKMMSYSYYMLDSYKYKSDWSSRVLSGETSSQESDGWYNSHNGGPGKGVHAALSRAGARAWWLRVSRVLPNRENEYCMMVLQTAEYSPSVAVSRLRHEQVCMTILSWSSLASFILTGDTQCL